MPGGAALAVHAGAGWPSAVRERADRVNITTYYTVTTSLASAAQQPLRTTNSSSESEQRLIFRGFGEDLQGARVRFKLVEAL